MLWPEETAPSTETQATHVTDFTLHPRKEDKNQPQDRKQRNKTYDFIVAVQCYQINLVLEDFK